MSTREFEKRRVLKHDSHFFLQSVAGIVLLLVAVMWGATAAAQQGNANVPISEPVISTEPVFVHDPESDPYLGDIAELVPAESVGPRTAGDYRLYLPSVSMGNAAQSVPTPIPTPTPVPTAEPCSQALEEAMAAAINSARGARGISSLHSHSALYSAARGHSIVMASQESLSHMCTGESPPSRRILDSGYTWYRYGETIGAMPSGEIGPMLTAWLNSPSHAAILLSTSYVDVGVGCAISGMGNYYWTVDAASPY